MTLSSFHLLPGVIAAHPRQLCRFNALAIQCPSGWLLMTTGSSTNLGSKRVVKPLPCSVIAPLLKVGVHALPRRVLPRQHPPLASADDNIQDRIDDRSHLQRARSTSWLCRWDQVFDTIPLTVGEIAWIRLISLHIPSVSQLPSLFKQALRHGSNELDTFMLVLRKHCQARLALFEPCLKVRCTRCAFLHGVVIFISRLYILWGEIQKDFGRYWRNLVF